MMSRAEYLLFDLDGTLTDSAPGIIASARYALSTLGVSEPENIMRFVGPPLYVSFSEYCGLDEEHTREAIRLYRERYSVTGLFENSVYPGIPEMLTRLKDGGRRLFVATSKPETFAVRILDRFGLSDFFELIGGADLEGSRDEKNKVIEYVLERAEVTDRSRAVMIGDRSHDIIGAKQCGITSMGVLWGYGSPGELAEHGADLTAADPSEAADILLSYY